MSQASCQPIKYNNINMLNRKPPVKRPGHNCRAGNFCRGESRESGRRRGGRVEHQRKAVHAVAQAGRLRSVVEDVTEMAAAAAAMNFGPQHPQSPVFGLADGVFEWLIKTRPAGAALEFRLPG